jgi:hypothetical protein
MVEIEDHGERVIVALLELHEDQAKEVRSGSSAAWDRPRRSSCSAELAARFPKFAEEFAELHAQLTNANDHRNRIRRAWIQKRMEASDLSPTPGLDACLAAPFVVRTANRGKVTERELGAA